MYDEQPHVSNMEIYQIPLMYKQITQTNILNIQISRFDTLRYALISQIKSKTIINNTLKMRQLDSKQSLEGNHHVHEVFKK